MNTSTHPMRVNLHTHTHRCHHASGEEREYIERAIECGLTTLGFSDHAPYVFKDGFYSGFRMFPNEQEDYFQTLTALREEYKDRLEIKIGYEAEYYPEFFSSFLELISPYPVDYLILGQHYTGNELDAPPVVWETKNESDLVTYVDQVITAVDTGLFTYIAHPDVLNFTGDSRVYEKHSARLIEHSKRFGIPLEINLLGMGGRHYPSERFFRLVGEIGAEVVIGSDAHSPRSVYREDMYERALEWCDRLGLRLNTAPATVPIKESKYFGG